MPANFTFPAFLNILYHIETSISSVFIRNLHQAVRSIGFLVRRFYQKTYGAEPVVTGNHCRLLVLHPAVVNILPAASERHYKGGNALPSAVAKTIWLFPAVGYKNLPFSHIASLRNRILVFFDKVVIARRSHYGNFDFLQFFSTARYCTAIIP